MSTMDLSEYDLIQIENALAGLDGLKEIKALLVARDQERDAKKDSR